MLEFVPRCAQHPTNTLPDEIVPSPVEPTPTSLCVPKSTLNVDVAEFLPRNYIKPSVNVPEIPQNEESLDNSSLPSEGSAVPPKDVDTSIKPKSNHRYRNIPAVAIPAATTTDKNKPSYSSISANRINNLNNNRSDKSSVAVVKESLDTAKIAPAKIDQVIMKSDLESKVVESAAKKEEFIFVDRNKKQGNNRNNTSKVSKKSTVKGNERLSKQSKIDGANSNDKIVIDKTDEKPALQIEQVVQQLPTYAQIIAPIISATRVISSVVAVDPPKQVKIETVITDEHSKILPKPMPPIQSWHTVKSKGKKKIQPVELSEDFWNEIEPEPTVITAPKIIELPPMLPVIETVPEVIVEPKPKANNLKASKKPKKSKAKKSSKQLSVSPDSEVIERNFVGLSVDIINECNDQIDSKSLVPIKVVEDSSRAEEFDISEFDFESNPAIFVNAITPSAIYTEQIVDKTMLNNSSGFSLNGSMNFNNCKFDFGSGGKGSSRVLREEEEMVMRAMRSLSFVNESKVDLIKPIEIELVSAPDDLMEEQLLDDTIAIPQDLIEKEDDNKCQLTVVTEPEAVDCSEINVIENTLREVENVRVESFKEGSEAVHSFAVDLETETEIKVQHQQLADLSNEFTQNVPEEIIESENIQDVLVCEEDLVESSVSMETYIVSSNEIDEISDAINQHEESAVTDFSKVPDDENDIIVNDNVKTDSSMTEMDTVGSSNASAEPADIDSVSVDHYDEYDEDSSTVVTQLNGYIEDVMVDPNFDTSVDEDDDMIIDIVTDGDIEELIKQATKIVQLTNGSTDWKNITSDPFDATASMMTEADDKDHQDRIESPRSSEDSGILDNHEDTMNSSEYDSGDCGVAESVTPPSGSLTQAVSRWLVQKQKEKSVEPILRLPGDPLLSESIEKSIQRIQISAMLKSYADDDDYGEDDEDDDELMTSDESDNEIEMPAPKNSKSNPLHVLSAENDNDQTCKRVANVNSKTLHATPIDALDQPDILEYWENDPMLHQPPTSANKSRINYAQLLDSVGTKTTDDILLSNNCYNNNDNTKLSNKTNNCSSPSQQQLNHKTTPKKSSSFNYFKPHEMSCKIM